MIDSMKIQQVLDELARLAIKAREEGQNDIAKAYWHAFDLLENILAS